MADYLGAVLDELGPGPSVLVGHSAGGPLVRLAAADRPERIAGLVLVDPSDEAFTVGAARTRRRPRPSSTNSRPSAPTHRSSGTSPSP